MESDKATNIMAREDKAEKEKLGASTKFTYSSQSRKWWNDTRNPSSRSNLSRSPAAPKSITAGLILVPDQHISRGFSQFDLSVQQRRSSLDGCYYSRARLSSRFWMGKQGFKNHSPVLRLRVHF